MPGSADEPPSAALEGLNEPFNSWLAVRFGTRAVIVTDRTPLTCVFQAPGVGLEPTTYGSTVPEKSSRAVHVRPPRPKKAATDSAIVY